MKMKLIMEKFNRFLDEARISPPPTRDEYISGLVDKIMQDPDVPEKAKEKFKETVESGNIESIKSMLVLISTFAPEYEGVENELDELPDKYDYDSGKERREFGAFSKVRLTQDIKTALDPLINLDDEDEDAFYYMMGYASPSNAKLDVRGQETPAEVSVGAVPDDMKAINNPYGDPFVFIDFISLEHIEMAKKTLESNGMRLAPQGLPRATKAKFVNPERTIVDSGKKSYAGRNIFQIKVKYAN